MSLIVTYSPHDNESGRGFYRRLAADNALFGWRNLTAAAGVKRKRNALFERPGEVASNLGLESDWVESARKQEEQSQKWGRLHRIHSDAVCPACLEEAPYLRQQWGHAYITACVQHGLALVDYCNACGNQLSPERHHIGMCTCGNDLRTLPRIPATNSQKWLSAQIGRENKVIANVPLTLHEADIDVLEKAVKILCLNANPGQPKLNRNYALPKSVAEAAQFLQPLESLLADWPAGFQAHVEKRIALGRKDARTLNTLLGDWYISLRKLCQNTSLEPLLQIIIDVAADKSNCLMGLDSASAMVKDATGYMRLPEAAKAIGISASSLHNAIQAGECEHRAKRTGTRGQVYEIPCDTIQSIQERRLEWISDVAACELAGVSSAVLERMKAAGIIGFDSRWRGNILKSGPVERNTIVGLFERLARNVEPIEDVGGGTNTFAEFTSRRMGDKRAIESLMRAISEGELKATTVGKTLGEFSFQKTDVARYFGTPLLEAGMSIQQLANVTGWKWESISHWADEGLLQCESIQRRGQTCRVVLPHHLLAFRQSYIPLADLARAMDTKASALSRLLPGVKLVGAKTVQDGALRGGLIQIAHLGQLAVLGARAGTDLFVPA